MSPDQEKDLGMKDGRALIGATVHHNMDVPRGGHTQVHTGLGTPSTNALIQS